MLMSDYPALKLLILVLVGIFSAQLSVIPLDYLMISAIIGLIFSILCFMIKKKGLSLIISGFSIGLILSISISNHRIDFPNLVLQSFKSNITGKVEKIIRVDSSKIKLILEGSCDAKELSIVDDIKIQLTIYGYEGDVVKYGDVVSCEAWTNIPKSPQLPKEFDERQYAASTGIAFFAKTTWKKVSVRESLSSFDRIVGEIRAGITDRIVALFDEDNEGVALALVSGDKSRMPYEIKKNFINTGTAHVLALSGLHVGIIALAISVLLGFIYNRKLKLLVFIIFIGAFVVITGLQPSTLRAGLMAVLFMTSLTFERRPKPLNIIALAVLLIIVFDPMMIYSAGLQMSVASICGIFLLYQPIRQTLMRMLPKNIVLTYLINSISVSIAAGAIVSPIVAFYFGNYSFAGFAANLIIIPLMSLGMIFSMLALLLSYISFDIGVIYSNSASLCFDYSNKINEFFSGIRYGFIDNEYAFPIAVIALMVIIYLFLSKSNRQFGFRLVYSIIAIIMIANWNIDLSREEIGIKIYPREQFVVAEIPMENDRTFFYLSERMPKQYPIRDYQIENYILSKENVILGINGNSTINLADNILKNKDIQVRSIPLVFQEFIETDIIGIQQIYKKVSLDATLHRDTIE
jgi:competence protein ComEC